jgi:hypothetical protein
MSAFKSKTIAGRIYDLAHLAPFTFTLQDGEASYHVEVAFSCHCFTEKLSEAHTPDFIYAHKHERRTFNMERYELSKSLPDLIQTLGKRSVYWSQKRDFFVLQDVRAGSGNAPYVVFFDAFKSSKQKVDVRLMVTSAYLKHGMSLRASPVRFSTLIASVATGKALKPGPPQQLKRK